MAGAGAVGPLIAFDFAFRGGANQDPVDKPGVATMATSLLDEGAGELDSKSFHERAEAKAIQLGFGANRDQTSGSLRTLSANQDEAFELLRLAITAPHFDAADIERIRDQLLSGLRRETTSPNEMASRRWWSTAFPGHPYGRPVRGTLEVDSDHHGRGSQGLHAAGVRPRHAQDRHCRRHRRCDRRQVHRQGVRRPAGQGRTCRRRGDAAAGARTEDLDRSRCPAVRVDSGRGRHSRAATPISWPPSWSITCSAAVRSPRGSIAKCAKFAASPIRCSAP